MMIGVLAVATTAPGWGQACVDQSDCPSHQRCHYPYPDRQEGTCVGWCGNGRVAGLEECDDGVDNSDTAPDACRTDCREAHCGDGTVDSGEECDEPYASYPDLIPDHCRSDCRRPWCGDGVVDVENGEQCEPGLEPGNDAAFCPECIRCWTPHDDLVFDEWRTAKLCPGEYWIADSNANGVLRVGAGVTLDCNGATLIGYKPPPPIRGLYSEPRRGIGIVLADGAAAHDCTVQGYATAFRLGGSGSVLFGNKACSNTTDMKAANGNYGVANACDRAPNWQENGKKGCTFPCPAALTVARVIAGEVAPGTMQATNPGKMPNRESLRPIEPQKQPQTQTQTRAQTQGTPSRRTSGTQMRVSGVCSVSGTVSGQRRYVREIAAMGDDGQIRGRSRVAVDGGFLIPGLEAGSYRVLALPAGKFALRVKPPSKDVECVQGALRVDFNVSGIGEG
jgi:hypothetical protein